MTMNNKVLYFHINPVKNEVFYVGIGTLKRAKSKHNRSNHWLSYIKKYDYDIMIEESNISWDEACELEKYWIKRIGRKDLGTGPLINLTDGGEGCLNQKMSIESRQKMSKSKRNMSDATKLKMSKSATGKKLSDTTKSKIAVALTGKIVTDTHRLNLSKSLTGRTVKHETCKKISEALKGNIPWNKQANPSERILKRRERRKIKCKI